MLGHLTLSQRDSRWCSLVPWLEGLGGSCHPRLWGCLLPPEPLRASPASFYGRLTISPLLLFLRFSLLFLFLRLPLSSALWVSLLPALVCLGFDPCVSPDLLVSVSLCLFLCLILLLSLSLSLSLCFYFYLSLSCCLSLLPPCLNFSVSFFPVSLLDPLAVHSLSVRPEGTVEPASPAQHFFSSPSISLSPTRLPANPVLPA